MRRGRTLPRVLAYLAPLVLVTLAALPPPTALHASVPTVGPTSPLNASGNGTFGSVAVTRYYASSVDGRILDLREWLPFGFNRAHAYPILVFLHGKGYQGSELPDSTGGASAISAGVTHGFIVVALDTRTANGFYVNSRYTGPQEQDVLDGIHFESAIHHVSAVYLLGMSMGTMGALSIAEHHPGLISGVAAVSACPDLFEVQDFKLSDNRSLDLEPWLRVTGGALADKSPYAAGLTYYLSAFRFFPQNLSHVALYMVQGGNDQDCPNNPHLWPFQQANDTMVNSTCLVSARLDEPASCTTPFAALAAASPQQYVYRYIFEPTAPHSLDDLNGLDMIHFFLNPTSSGTFRTTEGGAPPDIDESALPG